MALFDKLLGRNTMTTPTAIEVNCTTGEVIERPLTAEEVAQREADAQAAAARKAEEDAAKAAEEAAKASAQAKLATTLRMLTTAISLVQKRSKQKRVVFGADLINMGLLLVCTKNALKNKAEFVLFVKQIHQVVEDSFTQITTTIQMNQEACYAITAM